MATFALPIEGTLMAKAGTARAIAPKSQDSNWNLVIAVVGLIITIIAATCGTCFFLGWKANQIKVEISGFRSDVAMVSIDVASVRADIQKHIDADKLRDNLEQFLVENQLEIVKVLKRYYTPMQVNRILEEMNVKLKARKISQNPNSDFADRADYLEVK